MSSSLPQSAVSALRNGQMIEAIKLTRQELKLGLKEAKDLVDGFVESDPMLKAQLANKRVGGGQLLVAVVAIVLGMIAAYFALR